MGSTGLAGAGVGLVGSTGLAGAGVGLAGSGFGDTPGLGGVGGCASGVFSAGFGFAITATARLFRFVASLKTFITSSWRL